jgi:hypothetical protein
LLTVRGGKLVDLRSETVQTTVNDDHGGARSDE